MIFETASALGMVQQGVMVAVQRWPFSVLAPAGHTDQPDDQDAVAGNLPSPPQDDEDLDTSPLAFDPLLIPHRWPSGRMG